MVSIDVTYHQLLLGHNASARKTELSVHHAQMLPQVGIASKGTGIRTDRRV